MVRSTCPDVLSIQIVKCLFENEIIHRFWKSRAVVITQDKSRDRTGPTYDLPLGVTRLNPQWPFSEPQVVLYYEEIKAPYTHGEVHLRHGIFLWFKKKLFIHLQDVIGCTTKPSHVMSKVLYYRPSIVLKTIWTDWSKTSRYKQNFIKNCKDWKGNKNR